MDAIKIEPKVNSRNLLEALHRSPPHYESLSFQLVPNSLQTFDSDTHDEVMKLLEKDGLVKLDLANISLKRAPKDTKFDPCYLSNEHFAHFFNPSFDPKLPYYLFHHYGAFVPECLFKIRIIGMSELSDYAIIKPYGYFTLLPTKHIVLSNGVVLFENVLYRLSVSDKLKAEIQKLSLFAFVRKFDQQIKHWLANLPRGSRGALNSVDFFFRQLFDLIKNLGTLNSIVEDSANIDKALQVIFKSAATGGLTETSEIIFLQEVIDTVVKAAEQNPSIDFMNKEFLIELDTPTLVLETGRKVKLEP